VANDESTCMTDK